MPLPRNFNYLQPDEHSCGPMALKISLALLDQHLPSFGKLIDLCRTDQHGTSVPDLVAAAQKLNLSVKIIEPATLTDIIRVQKTSPDFSKVIIVNYLYSYHRGTARPKEESGHYAVVSAYRPDTHHLSVFDSYTGRRRSYSWDKFLPRWYDYDYHPLSGQQWHRRLMLVLSVQSIPDNQSIDVPKSQTTGPS